MKQKSRTFRKLLSLTLCLIMVLGSVAVGGDGIAELLDNFAVKASAEETGYKYGDSIYLGKYPQSEITDITGLTEDVDYVTFNNKYYAYEPIEWKVIDAEKGLCVSNYALNAMAFDSDSNDYANSDIRAWLYGADGTGNFYANAFTDTEKSAINSTEVASTVTDKVFLLSVEEASNTSYFADDSARICYPTAYAIENGARTDSGNNNSCFWWLRSPGSHSHGAAYVYSSGVVVDSGRFVSSDDDCVRPALYLNLKSEIFKSETTLDANNGADDPIKNTVTSFKSYYPECTFTNGTKTFCGWYKDAECQQPWTETDTVIGNMTLYAGWTDFEKGEVIKLGTYEQDNNTENGKEAIEWTVLDPSTGLCVSRYALDSMRFDDDSNDYASSEIRAWLYGENGTGEFYADNFTDAEKSAMLQKNIESTIADKVFLLSLTEVSNENYFKDIIERRCAPTDYSRAGLLEENCDWWLRSPSTVTGNESEYAVYVRSSGGVYTFGSFVSDSIYVRPAIYMNLESEIIKTEITSDMVEDIPEYKYTGKELKPTVTVKDGENTLTENTDYTVAYSDNINVGTATVTIKGISKYKGVVTKTFTISAKAITEEMISGVYNASYTGKPIERNIVVKDGDKALTENTDYTVSYKDNTNAGPDASVTITGIGNYGETVTEKFTISPAAQSAPMGITSTDETKCSASDGTISGLSTDMEIAFEVGTYTPCTGETMTGLAPGFYFVRYAEKANYSASDSTQVEIKNGDCYGEPVKENEVAPTCTEAGSYESVVYCLACGDEISRETITVPATGHIDEDSDGKCDVCGIITDEDLANPCRNALIEVPSDETIGWKFRATMTAEGKGIPEGYHIAWYEGDTKVSDSARYTTGSLTEAHTYTAKIVDSDGNIASNDSQNKSVTVTVRNGIFNMIISFFLRLFGRNTVTIGGPFIFTGC